jgi:hypothetical protein
MARLALNVSEPMDDLLTSLAQRLNGTKADVMRSAVLLLEQAVKAREQNKKFGIVDQDAKLETEIEL